MQKSRLTLPVTTGHCR